jgi:hypothetical protein
MPGRAPAHHQGLREEVPSACLHVRITRPHLGIARVSRHSRLASVQVDEWTDGHGPLPRSQPRRSISPLKSRVKRTSLVWRTRIMWHRLKHGTAPSTKLIQPAQSRFVQLHLHAHACPNGSVPNALHRMLFLGHTDFHTNVLKSK